MSAPVPPATPSPTRPTLPRSLLAAVLAAVGFVVVWQGFGLAGFGTDVHLLRVIAALVVLFIHARILVWPGVNRSGRVLAALVGLGIASAAWWFVPCAADKYSLSQAVAEQERDKEWLATPTVEAFDQRPLTRELLIAFEVYPSLTQGARDASERWKAGVADDIITRYSRITPDDWKAAAALSKSAGRLALHRPEDADRLEDASRLWIDRAVQAKIDQLAGPPNVFKGEDWANFNRTAADRHTLAEAFPETRTALVKAEEKWVKNAVVWRIAVTRIDPPEPPMRVKCRECEKDLLALNALDTSDERFMAARTQLFKEAHDAAKWEVAAHLDAGRYELAFGVARKHAVEWNATATALGAAELKQLDSLRETCEFFEKLAAKSARPAAAPEVAPPPRTKP